MTRTFFAALAIGLASAAGATDLELGGHVKAMAMAEYNRYEPVFSQYTDDWETAGFANLRLTAEDIRQAAGDRQPSGYGCFLHG